MSRKFSRREFLTGAGVAATATIALSVPALSGNGTIDIEVTVEQSDSTPVQLLPDSVAVQNTADSLTISFKLLNPTDGSQPLPLVDYRLYDQGVLLERISEGAGGGLPGGDVTKNTLTVQLDDPDRVTALSLEVLD